MFKWKKNSSRDSVVVSRPDSFNVAVPSNNSFAHSRDSFVVTSPSAASETNSGPNTAGLFVADYRDQRLPKQESSGHPTSVYTPTSSRSQSSSPDVASKSTPEVVSKPTPFQQVQPLRRPSFSVAAPPSPAPPSPATNFAYLELETHNNAFEQHNRMLVARISELKGKHSQLLSEIKSEEEEKSKFQEHVAVLRKRLGQVTHALDAQRELCSTVDKLIEETEDGYMKIVETSKTILQMLDNDYSQIYSKRRSAVENAFRD